MRAWVVTAALFTLALSPAAAREATPPFPVGEGGKREGWSWTWMDEKGLALGGGGLDGDDIAYLHDEGFRAIVNFRIEYPDDEAALEAHAMDYLFVPTSHAESDTMPLSDLHKALDFIEAKLAEGKPVYVHCIAGWHRSLVPVLAYVMKTRNLRMEEAAKVVENVRPGIELRWADVLYEYEAEMFGQQKVTVDLWADRMDIAPDETVNVTALVTHNGRPIEGARVDWIEEYRSDGYEQKHTDANGTATFQFTPDGSGPLQYVHATAWKDGFVSGYDRNQFWVNRSKDRPPTEFRIESVPSHVAAGTLVSIPVAVGEVGKHQTNARVTVTSACATHFRDWTGWDGRMDVTFVAPERNGTYNLTFHVNRFPAEPVFERASLVVGSGGPEPPCPQPPPPTPTPPTPASTGLDGRYAVPVGGMHALLAFALAGLAMRRRAARP